jgi:hypothetical protein
VNKGPKGTGFRDGKGAPNAISPNPRPGVRPCHPLVPELLKGRRFRFQIDFDSRRGGIRTGGGGSSPAIIVTNTHTRGVDQAPPSSSSMSLPHILLLSSRAPAKPQPLLLFLHGCRKNLFSSHGGCHSLLSHSGAAATPWTSDCCAWPSLLNRTHNLTQTLTVILQWRPFAWGFSYPNPNPNPKCRITNHKQHVRASALLTLQRHLT